MQLAKVVRGSMSTAERAIRHRDLCFRASDRTIPTAENSSRHTTSRIPK